MYKAKSDAKVLLLASHIGHILGRRNGGIKASIYCLNLLIVKHGKLREGHGLARFLTDTGKINWHIEMVSALDRVMRDYFTPTIFTKL